MKQTILLFIVFISINTANARFSDNHAFYLTGEFNIGNYVGIDFNLNYVYQELYALKIGYSGNVRTPKYRPVDYHPGLLSFGPLDYLSNYQITVGKLYKFNDKGTIRANISVGLGYTTITEPTNWQGAYSGWFSSNYTSDYYEYNTVSLIINPKIEFPTFTTFGPTITGMIQINKDRVFYGLGIGFMLGVLRKEELKPWEVKK
ncbi:MAG: hypothetical protein CVV22_00340 [Ignavibacteriae bacterium HGW-Ignavibacteriae-1]|jgi:hypothetical protein|nr:MAG: hypothetical protein CVV22_00340 [Ignavibacteriae bacterium HGW-Ignavibacteriae-1]